MSQCHLGSNTQESTGLAADTAESELKSRTVCLQNTQMRCGFDLF